MNFLIESLFLILFFLFFYFTLKIYLIRKRYEHIPGPRNKGIIDFYFGQYFQVKKHTSNDKKILSELLLKWTRIHGPVFCFQMFNRIIVVCNNEESVRSVLIDLDLPKSGRGSFTLDERFFGRSILVEVDKDKWRHTRNIMNHGFKKNNLMENLDEFNSKGDCLIEKLKFLSESNSSSLPIFEHINRTTLDVIAKVAFDLETDSLNNIDNKLNYYCCRGLQAITVELNDPFCRLSQPKLVKKLRESLQKLRTFSLETLKEKINDLNESSSIQKENSILSLIIKSARTDDGFDYEKLVDDFVTFFIAGQETTANALSFCLFELGQNPHVLNKLREEVDRVLGDKREISDDDLSKLEYTSAVFNESLRKWPPVPFTFRTNFQDVEILNYKIPKNSWVMVSSYLMSRCEQNYPTPESFRPERFLKEDPFSLENKINSYTYFPFSLGPRNCIGHNFAKIEGRIILAKLIQNFDFKLDPNQSFDIVQYATIRPVDGVKVFIKSR
nr:cytochrome P450 3049E1 [Brachionus rubens]